MSKQTGTNAPSETTTSTVYLLDLVTSHVPPALLRSQFSSIITSLAPQITHPESDAPLVRSAIGCLESLLRAQDATAWSLPQTSVGPRQAILLLLALAVDARPKVRRRAQDALTYTLQNPPPGPALDHPAAELCATATQTNLKRSVEEAQQARKRKGRPDDSHEPAVIHALQLTKTIATASGGWPSNKIEQLCELLLSISRSKSDYLVMSAFEVFETIFEGTQDDFSSSKLPRLLEAIVELKPAQQDSQLLPPWIAVVSRGYGTAAKVEPEETFANLPELIDLISSFLTASSHNVRISASECLISFFANCIPDTVISEPSIHDEKILDQVASRALGLLAVKYQTAWFEVFSALSALFDALRWRGDPCLLAVVQSIGELRGSDAFQGKTEADEVLGSAIRNLGPAAVLSVLPHNLIKPQKGRPGRAWLLPLLRDHVSNTNLAHFKSDLVPLSEAMFQRVLDHGDAEKTMDIKIFETVVHQIWASFPGYCDLPLDLHSAFDQKFAEMVSNLLYSQADLRVDLCRGLQNLVESNQALLASELENDVLMLERRLNSSDAEANIRHLSGLAGNLLAVLFNVYSQTLPQSRAYIIQCIDAFLSITPEKDLVDTFDRVAKMLESELPKTERKPPQKPKQEAGRNKMPPSSHTLLDLIIALSVHLPRSTFASLFALANHVLTNAAILKSDPQLIKKAYKIIPRIATSATGAEALQSRSAELRKLVFDTADKTPVPARRDRLHAINTLIRFLPVEDLHFVPTIISEVVLACKDSNEKARHAGFDLLIAVAEKIIDPSNPEGTVIRNCLVPHMQDDSPDVPARIEEVFSMVSAGLAGVAPHMVASSITALSRLLFEFHDSLDVKTTEGIVDTALMFLESNNREIVRSVLGFVKVIVVVLSIQTLEPRMEKIVPGLMVWSHENKGRMRQKVRNILDRSLRRFGTEKVEQWVGPEDRKTVVNIRKRKERSRRNKKGTTEDDDEDEAPQAYDNEYDKEVYGSDDDDSDILGSDDDDDDTMSGVTIKPGHKQNRKQHKQYIRQDDEDDEPLDLLDPRSMASITSRKIGRLRDTQNRKTKAKTNEDGKLVFGDGGDENEMLVENDQQGSGGVDAYMSAVSGPDAVQKGQKGKLKIKSGQGRRGDEMDLDDNEARDLGMKLGHGRNGSAGSLVSTRGNSRDPRQIRRGLGVEKGRGPPQREKFRGGRGVGKRDVRFSRGRGGSGVRGGRGGRGSGRGRGRR